MQEIKYFAGLDSVIEQLPRGAFLTVDDGTEKNTMTIGWGNIGYIWNLPIFEVLVRESRHTYKLINRADEFTVSVPLQNQLEEELSYCGSRSGRDVDKFKELDLETSPGQKLNTPFISGCDIFYECDIVYSQKMNRSDLKEEIKENNYPDSDYHTIYYGEIKGVYKN